MVEVIKLGHVGLVAKNYDAMLHYYKEILGLKLMAETTGASYFRVGVEHHAVALYKGDEAGLHHVAFQVDPKYSAAEVAKALSEKGIPAQVEHDTDPWIPEVVSFRDLDGTRVELYGEVPLPSSVENLTAIAPLKLGHVARGVADVRSTCSYYETQLGFRVSDWMEDFFVFLRCSPDHHSVNFIKAPAHNLHHVAFQVSDWSHIQRSSDILATHGIPLTWGPVRHGIGHNISIYHLNPDGSRVELFCEMDLMLDERLGYFEPRPWHEDNPQRPKVWKGTSRTRNIWGIGPPEAHRNA